MANTVHDLAHKLAAAGLDAVMILRIIEFDKEVTSLRCRVAELEAELQEVRGGQRRRQKGYRERNGKKVPALRNGDVTHAQLSFLLPLNNSQCSPSEERGSREDARARGTALPADWRPSDSDRAYGDQLGFDNFQIEAMAEDMRLWAGANRNRAVARKADWGLTFKGWMRRAASKMRPGPRNGGGGSAFDVSRDLEQMINDGGTVDEPITHGAGAIGHSAVSNSGVRR